MRVIALGVFGIYCIATAASAAAQDACIELIRNAVYDEVAGSEKAKSYKEANTEFCKTWEEDVAKNKSFDSGGSYGAISGYGNLSDDEKRRFRESMCDKKYSLEKHSLNRQIFAKTLNPAALNVVDNCIRASEDGLRFDAQYKEDENKLVVGVSFGAKTGDPSKFRLINDRNNVPAGITCTGQLADVRKGTRITNDATSMTCVRADERIVDVGGCRVNPSGTVVISTNVRPLLAFMPKKIIDCPKPVPVLDISGDWLFAGQDKPWKANIAVNDGSRVVFTNERRQTSQGRRKSTYSVEAFDWSYITGDVRNLVADKSGPVLVWSNGTWWSRTEFDKIPTSASAVSLVDNSWRYVGRAASITGSDDKLMFINEKGQPSAGRLLDATTVEATGWRIKGKLIENRSAILWSNGTVWIR